MNPARTPPHTAAGTGPGDVHDAVLTAIQTAVLGAQWVHDDGEYARQDRRFQHLVARGIEPGPWVAVERGVLDESQVPSGARRRDLVEVYDAMCTEPELDAVLRHCLAGHVDTDALGALCAIVEHDDERTVVRVVIEGGRAWPGVLGGAGIPGEIERVYTIYARRAPWRDRAVRRLARVEVAAVEIHPDPFHSAL